MLGVVGRDVSLFPDVAAEVSLQGLECPQVGFWGPLTPGTLWDQGPRPGAGEAAVTPGVEMT